MAQLSSATEHEVGRRIRLRRLELTISQKALGAELGVSFQQIQKYEKGTNRVSAGRLQQIARFLKVPITFFYEDVASRHSSQISIMLEAPYALRLLKAFSRLQNRRLQRKAVELIEAMIGDHKKTRSSKSR